MTTTEPPHRIQRRRVAGWTAPLDAEGRKPLYVGRGTRWGNPWKVVQNDTVSGWAVHWHGRGRCPVGLRRQIPAYDQRDAHALAVELYESWIYGRSDLLAAAREQLAGRDLMCWCPESMPCHADVLLAIANSKPGR